MSKKTEPKTEQVAEPGLDALTKAVAESADRLDQMVATLQHWQREVQQQDQRHQALLAEYRRRKGEREGDPA